MIMLKKSLMQFLYNTMMIYHDLKHSKHDDTSSMNWCFKVFKLRNCFTIVLAISWQLLGRHCAAAGNK